MRCANLLGCDHHMGFAQQMDSPPETGAPSTAGVAAPNIRCDEHTRRRFPDENRVPSTRRGGHLFLRLLQEFHEIVFLVTARKTGDMNVPAQTGVDQSGNLEIRKTHARLAHACGHLRCQTGLRFHGDGDHGFVPAFRGLAHDPGRSRPRETGTVLGEWFGVITQSPLDDGLEHIQTKHAFGVSVRGRTPSSFARNLWSPGCRRHQPSYSSRLGTVHPMDRTAFPERERENPHRRFPVVADSRWPTTVTYVLYSIHP